LNTNDIHNNNHNNIDKDIYNRRPCLHNHLLNSAKATVGAVLCGIATRSTYFENASVMERIYFLPLPDVLSGPNSNMT
jgi:hypothetical protein